MFLDAANKELIRVSYTRFIMLDLMVILGDTCRCSMLRRRSFNFFKGLRTTGFRSCWVLVFQHWSRRIYKPWAYFIPMEAMESDFVVVAIISV